jgi:hypothetical protein
MGHPIQYRQGEMQREKFKILKFPATVPESFSQAINFNHFTDYIMTTAKSNEKVKSYVWVEDFNIRDYQTKAGDSLSDHLSVYAEIKTRCLLRD